MEGQSAIASRAGEVAARVGDLQQAIADTEQTFKETRDRILEGVHDLEIHLVTIEERLAMLEDDSEGGSECTARFRIHRPPPALMPFVL